MFVVSKRNIVIPGPNGQSIRLKREWMGEIPDWAGETEYFQDLVKDHKVFISATKKDKELQKAENETPVDHARDDKKEDGTPKEAEKAESETAVEKTEKAKGKK